MRASMLSFLDMGPPATDSILILGAAVHPGVNTPEPPSTMTHRGWRTDGPAPEPWEGHL